MTVRHYFFGDFGTIGPELSKLPFAHRVEDGVPRGLSKNERNDMEE
jgi:hypothetical protein